MPETVGTYRLLDRLGDDRLGEHFRARDTAHGRTAFVRVVSPSIAGDPALRARVTAAASVAARASHPAVAALFDVIDEPPVLAFAHEHVDGQSLGAMVGGHAINPRMALAIGIQIADGLSELHAHGLAHGAVDPDHVVITPRGQAKLLDAGLTPWLVDPPPHATPGGDIAALGALLRAITGNSTERAQWSDDLRVILDRTAPAHPKRFETAPTLAAELRSVSAMLEARAEAAALQQPRGSGASVIVWALLALVLLALGGWLLFG